jgi:head-tail adaptor
MAASRGQKRHKITLQNPGPAVPDGEGGFTFVPVMFATRMARITPATTRDLERVTSGTVQSSASHLVEFDYLAGVTTKTEIVFKTRVFTVEGITNPEEKNVTLICICSEVVA